MGLYVCFTFHCLQVGSQVPLQFAAFSLWRKHTNTSITTATLLLKTALYFAQHVKEENAIYRFIRNNNMCTHILFGEVDNSLLKGSIFGLIGFAKLLEDLYVKPDNNISNARTEQTGCSLKYPKHVSVHVFAWLSLSHTRTRLSSNINLCICLDEKEIVKAVNDIQHNYYTNSTVHSISCAAALHGNHMFSLSNTTLWDTFWQTSSAPCHLFRAQLAGAFTRILGPLFTTSYT